MIISTNRVQRKKGSEVDYKQLAVVLSEAQAEELIWERELRQPGLGGKECPLALIDQHWHVEDLTPLRKGEV